MEAIRPIRSEADYAWAMAEIEALWGAKSGSLEGDRLDVLATLIDAYENEHFPIAMPDPVEALKFRMEQRGLTRKELEPVLGSRMRVSEVLSGKRSLSLKMIRRLHEALQIPTDILIQPRTGTSSKAL